MTTGGFSSAGLQALHDTMARHVENGPLPGLVLGVRRGDHAHLDAMGSISARGAPMPTDARFRITSMTRPVTAVAALMLVDDGLLELDEPVDRLLPELADRQVLRRLDGPIDDTVPAHRPITVRDLLTMRGGFGMILAPPDAYPVLQAEGALELCSAGPRTRITPACPQRMDAPHGDAAVDVAAGRTVGVRDRLADPRRSCQPSPTISRSVRCPRTTARTAAQASLRPNPSTR